MIFDYFVNKRNMDTLQIISVQRTLFKHLHVQYGCNPCDALDTMEIRKYPFAMCLNDQPSGEPGQHWVGVFIPARNQPMEFFCSYGRPMEQYADNFKNFALRQGLPVLQSNICIQSPFSTVCGNHVLYFLYNRVNKCSRYAFYGKFSKHVKKNDNIVHNFVKRINKYK